MRNKDVLKKLKNLPDNTKEYVDNINDYHKVIDNAIEFEIANGTISSLSTYSQNKADGDAYNMKYVNSNKIIDATNTYGIPILITISDGNKHMHYKTILNGLEGSPYCCLQNIKISFYNNKTIQLKIYNKKNFDSSFNLVESNGCCFTINYGGNATAEQYRYLDSLNISILLVDYNYLTLDNVVEYTPKDDYNPVTKKYVDDNIGNVPLKKITSTEQTPIIISELSDGIYDFGNTSFVKMFSSDTEILKNVLGICILYSISDVKKILFVNFKSNIAIFNVEDRYALDIQNKTYTMLQFTKLVSIGGSSSTPVVLLDEITENGGKSFGLYQTTCSSLKLTANSKIVSLDAGSKILLVTSTSVKEITTYRINSFGAFSIKKIKYEYNKNTKEATLISEDSAVFNKELEDTKYNLQKAISYINNIYDNRLTVLNTNIKNATYVNNDITNNANITRYFNIDKTLDGITKFDTCFINLKYYVSGILRTYSFKTSFNKTYNHFSVLGNTVDCKIIVELVVDKQVNEKLEVIDAPGKCYFDIKYARNAEDYAIKAIDSGNVEVQLSSNKILKIDNNYEYTPTEDYHPVTKKYVDDTTNTLVKKDTNKYILICNDDTLVIKKDNITDIANATVTIDNLTGKFGTLVANDNGTYSYTLNTIMTDVETFAFKVNNVEQKLVIVPYKEMTYDDKNSGITYDDKWTVEEDSKHYKGSAHKIENKIGTSTIIFKGTGIDVYTKISPICGSSTIDIYKGIGSKKEDGKYKPSLYTNYIENKSNDTHYKQPTTSVKKLNFNTYTSEIMGGVSNSTYYLDYIVIYNTLGNDLNDSIRRLYYAKDNAIGVLRTDIPNGVFEPKELYDPTTKKYVDDANVEATDEEVDAMLLEVLGGDYSVQS